MKCSRLSESKGGLTLEKFASRCNLPLPWYSGFRSTAVSAFDAFLLAGGRSDIQLPIARQR